MARIVAEGGSTVEHPLLAAVAGLAEDDLIEALRAAVGANVLLPADDGDGYRFRHSLVREAVSDDLLPGERSRLNRRYAEALEADPVARTGRRARRAPRQLLVRRARRGQGAARRARRASVAARRRHAYAEQLRLLERAMELWDDAPDGRARAPAPASTTPRSTRPAAASPRTRCATSTCWPRPPSPPASAANASGPWPSPRRPCASWTTRTGPAARGVVLGAALPARRRASRRGDGWEELATAQELVRGLPPSAVHADVLAYVAALGRAAPTGPETLVAAERAVEYARLVGAEHIELNARITRGWLLIDAGDIEERPRRDVRGPRPGSADAAGLARRDGPRRTSTSPPRWRPAAAPGRPSRPPSTASICHEHGLPDIEAWYTGQPARVAASRWAAGRRPDGGSSAAAAAGPAPQVARPGRRTAAPIWPWPRRLRGGRAQLALDRRHLGSTTRSRSTSSARPGWRWSSRRRQGRLPEARAAFEQVAAQGFPLGHPALRAGRCSARPRRSEARRARAARGRRAGGAAILERIRRRDAKRLPALVPVWAAYGLLSRPNCARAEGRRPGPLGRPVAAFEPLDARTSSPGPPPLGGGPARPARRGRPGDRPRALLRQAHAVGRHGSGAAPLAESGDSSRPARIALTGSTPRRPAPGARPGGRPGRVARPDPAGTGGPAAGRGGPQQPPDRARSCTSRPKTASVHVSNILAKLGVSGRGEAAALAHRFRLYAAG